LLQELGERIFPGVKEAEVLTMRVDDRFFAGRTPEQLEADGILLIGLGGGRFDEHAVGNKPRVEGHSAASLVAEYLGCADSPIYKQLVEYATGNDLNGRTSRFEWAGMLDDMHAKYAHAPVMVANWVNMYLDAHVSQQKAFHIEARDALKRAKMHRRQLGKSTVQIVSVQTDAEKVKARAFSSYGGYKAVLVQRNHRGNIQVFANPHHQLDLTQVVAEVRKAELTRRKGTPGPEVDYSAEGTLESVPAWHFFKEGNMLLNGSLTAPDVTPSHLSLEEVTELVLSNIRKIKRPHKDKELAMSGANQA
jgi:hypothetical protein